MKAKQVLYNRLGPAAATSKGCGAQRTGAEQTGGGRRDETTANGRRVAF